MSEVANYLKVGTTSIVLSMIEDDFIDRDLTLDNPVQAFRQVSRDLPAGRRSASATDGPRRPSISSGSSWSWPTATTGTGSSIP